MPDECSPYWASKLAITRGTTDAAYLYIWCQSLLTAPLVQRDPTAGNRDRDEEGICTGQFLWTGSSIQCSLVALPA